MLAWTGGLIVAFGAGLSLLRFVGRNPVEAAAEAALASVALGAVVAAPGMLVLLAGAGRASLLMPAGVVLVPLSFLSMAGVLLPLLVPAVLLLVAYARRRRREPRPVMPAAVTTVVVLSCLVGAVLALLAHPDPRSYSTPTGGGSTSDVVTYGESLLSLGMVTIAVVLGAAFSRPVPHAPG